MEMNKVRVFFLLTCSGAFMVCASYFGGFVGSDTDTRTDAGADTDKDTGTPPPIEFIPIGSTFGASGRMTK